MRKGTIKISVIRSLLILLMASFVLSTLYPCISGETPSVNLEEIDMDGQESNEEQKEKEENKESIQHDFLLSFGLPIKQYSILKNKECMLIMKELYLPVITPPPDIATSAS